MTAAMNAGQLQKKRATTAVTCNAIRKMPLPQFVLRRFGSVVCVWCPVVIKTFLLFVLQYLNTETNRRVRLQTKITKLRHSRTSVHAAVETNAHCLYNCDRKARPVCVRSTSPPAHHQNLRLRSALRVGQLVAR